MVVVADSVLDTVEDTVTDLLSVSSCEGEAFVIDGLVVAESSFVKERLSVALSETVKLAVIVVVPDLVSDCCKLCVRESDSWRVPVMGLVIVLVFVRLTSEEGDLVLDRMAVSDTEIEAVLEIVSEIVDETEFD